MNSTTPIAAAPLDGGRAATADTPVDPAQVRALAQQFEAMLLSQMLRDMKASMTPDADREGLGAPIFADTLHTELGLSLSRAGGVGLADVLMRGLRAYDTPRAGTGASSGGAGIGGDVAATRPVIAAAPSEETRGTAIALPEHRGVTSDYGWRTDPINGQARFHGGMDLRYAYGQAVHAAAAGTVTYSGEQGGYGTVVIVQHGNGLETRYAHLSAADVAVGTQVEAGAVIARAGSSGRSTGPHLHFEVRQDGHPVDPQALTDLP